MRQVALSPALKQLFKKMRRDRKTKEGLRDPGYVFDKDRMPLGAQQLQQRMATSAPQGSIRPTRTTRCGLWPSIARGTRSLPGR